MQANRKENAVRFGTAATALTAARLHAQEGLAEYRLRPLHANPLVCGRATPAYLGRLVSRFPKARRDQGRPLVRLWAGL